MRCQVHRVQCVAAEVAVLRFDLAQTAQKHWDKDFAGRGGTLAWQAGVCLRAMVGEQCLAF